MINGRMPGTMVHARMCSAVVMLVRSGRRAMTEGLARPDQA